MHNPIDARMAELVDALVSNTNDASRAGSIPASGTRKIANSLIINLLAIFCLVIFPKFFPHAIHVPTFSPHVLLTFPNRYLIYMIIIDLLFLFIFHCNLVITKLFYTFAIDFYTYKAGKPA